MTRAIAVKDLVPMDLFETDFPVAVEVMYAGPESFCGPVYRKGARLSLHRDMAEVVLLTAHLIHKRSGGTLMLYDGLRTTTVQALICDTPIVKAHPHWTAEGPLRMFAPPGKGGHPRGMAIDVSIRGRDGVLLDMGTIVDALPEGGADRDTNPAHREYPHQSALVIQNRALLTDSFMEAAATLGQVIRPLPAEWWDFRFPDEVYNAYAPLSDADVPPSLRLSDQVPAGQGCAELPAEHYQNLAGQIRARLKPHLG